MKRKKEKGLCRLHGSSNQGKGEGRSGKKKRKSPRLAVLFGEKRGGNPSTAAALFRKKKKKRGKQRAKKKKKNLCPGKKKRGGWDHERERGSAHAERGRGKKVWRKKKEGRQSFTVAWLEKEKGTLPRMMFLSMGGGRGGGKSTHQGKKKKKRAFFFTHKGRRGEGGGWEYLVCLIREKEREGKVWGRGKRKRAAFYEEGRLHPGTNSRFSEKKKGKK